MSGTVTVLFAVSVPVNFKYKFLPLDTAPWDIAKATSPDPTATATYPDDDCSNCCKFVLVIVPQVPAFSPVVINSKFKSLLIEKDFEPENPKQLEELTDDSCKWPIGHPDEKDFYFCGRTSLKDFSYCKLHLLYAFQPKGKKEDLVDKNNEVPKFIEKKIKSA